MFGQIKLPGLLVGLIGNALVGYGLYVIIRGAGCVPMTPACEAAMMPGMYMLVGGILASTIALFVGGGGVVFSGLFLAIGLGPMAASAFHDLGEMESFGWLFGGIFAVSGLLPLLGGRGLKAMAAKKEAQAKRLIESGSRGIGTIAEVNDTGMTINDDPRVEIVVRIEPVGGGATIERRKKSIVPRVAIPRIGDRYPVFYDPADPANWVMGMQMADDAPADIKDMFARAGLEAPAGGDGLVGELERLDALRRAGTLTAEEFARAKSALLDRMAR